MTVVLIIVGGAVVLLTPFGLAYVLVQKPADEWAAARKAAKKLEKAARRRSWQKELTR